jgi:hypothetical protein
MYLRKSWTPGGAYGSSLQHAMHAACSRSMRVKSRAQALVLLQIGTKSAELQ